MGFLIPQSGMVQVLAEGPCPPGFTSDVAREMPVPLQLLGGPGYLSST